MAGGRGTRLKPYTIALPKPLVPVGEYPIMEIVIKQLAYYGFKRIIITVNHQADLIKTYFGNGERYGLAIEYSLETVPLSTMGPLKLIGDLPESFIVMNSDVLTDMDFGEFLTWHHDSNTIFTVSASKRIQNIDYGVLHTDGSILTGFEEKPKIDYLVSMGVYAVSSATLEYIPSNTFFGFDDLMRVLLRKKKRVSVREYSGYWLDIGRPDDYQIATEEFTKNRSHFLKL